MICLSSGNDNQPFPETYPFNNPPGPLRSLVGKRLTPAYMLGWVIDRRFAREVLGLDDPDTSLDYFVRRNLSNKWSELGHSRNYGFVTFFLCVDLEH